MITQDSHKQEKPGRHQPVGLEARQDEFLVAQWRVLPSHNVIRQASPEPLERQLEPRLMKLLCLLATCPGEVLGRQALMDALWPHTVVNENSLTRAVSDLRRLLQDEQKTRFIETVPKRGYKLISPVEAYSCAVTEHAAGRSPDTEATGAGRWRWLHRHTPTLAVVNSALTLALTAVLVPTLLAGLSGNDGNPGPATGQLVLSEGPSEEGSDAARRAREIVRSLTPATARSMEESDAGNASLSPDGELMAFTRRTDEGSTLMIGSTLDSTDPLQVYSTRHRISHLEWSPVGSALMFSVLPTISHAALGDPQPGRLMLFDLQDLSLKELYRSEGKKPADVPDRFDDALNIT